MSYPVLPVPEYNPIPVRDFVTPTEDRLSARRAIRRDANARRYATAVTLDAAANANHDARLGRMTD